MLGEPVDDQLVPSALPGGAVIPYRSPRTARLDPLLERGAGWCVVVGIAALADGSYLLAFTQLRQLFSEEGAPVHKHLLLLGRGRYRGCRGSCRSEAGRTTRPRTGA